MNEKCQPKPLYSILLRLLSPCDFLLLSLSLSLLSVAAIATAADVLLLSSLVCFF